MPSTWLYGTCQPAGVALDQAATIYAWPTGTLEVNTTDNREAQVNDSYTLDNLFVLVTANNVDNASTIRTRKNGANGGLSVSVAANTTGDFEDQAGSDSLIDGDTWGYQVVVGAGAGGDVLTLTLISVTADAGSDIPFLLSSTSASVGATLTRYYAVIGSQSVATTEADVQYRFRVASTLSNLTVRVITNASTGTTTVRLRKNTADGNQVLSIATLATWFFEDAVNTDSIASGDLVDTSAANAGASGSISIQNSSYKSAAVGQQVGVLNHAGVGFTADRYQPIAGRMSNGGTTESTVDRNVPVAFDAKNMFVRSTANTRSDATTVAFRVNAANSALSVSIGASTSGEFEDTVDTISVVVNDDVNWFVDIGAGTGTLTLSIIGLELNQPAGAAPSLFPPWPQRIFQVR